MASVAKLKDLVDALVLSCGDSEQSLEDCVSGLEVFFDKIESSPALKKALESPVVKPEEKILVVKDLCAAPGVPVILGNFLAAVAEFDRFKTLFIRGSLTGLKPFLSAVVGFWKDSVPREALSGRR